MISQPLGPESLKTYQIASPITSHYRAATCDEVSCENHQHGWVTVIDESTELGQRQAHYIRTECRPETLELAVTGHRRYREARTGAGWTEFTFGPGQQCFAQHQVRLHRPEIYVVRDGDRRGNPRRTPARRHDQPEHWVEDFSEHHDHLKTLIERG